MAEPEQEAELLNGSVSHSLSHGTGMVDATNDQADHDGMSEELLSQALADANAFDTGTITYAVTSEESEMCDTVQDHACVNESLSAHRNGSRVHMSATSEAELVHSSESILTNQTGAIFSNGTDSILTNSASEVLGVDGNETFTVDVGSLPKGHIISIPNDIMSGSVIVSHASEDQFQQHAVQISDESQLLEDETQEIVQHIESHYVQNTDTQMLHPDSDSQIIQNETFTQPHTITMSTASGMTLTPEVLQNVIQQIHVQQLAQQQAAAVRKQPAVQAAPAPPNTVRFTLVSPSQHNSNSPPLGSSQNPIRIIQQGNRYTPMQQLTPEQLQQIMQVVQQQHVNKNTQENGGAVIFNPQTNTKIMYRVIYPSELHKTQNGIGPTTYQVVRPSTSSQEQQTGTPQQKRPYRKRKDIVPAVGVTGEEEDKEKSSLEGPELSKEEKEERKKHRPRTRSGRVSKPPKHMVQDYKHIHVLDWDEDYDDSDGGYSDFKHSDEETKAREEGEEDHSASPEFFQALGAGRPKNHKCQTCDKSYIGQAGLARHYRLNPDHCTNPSENDSILSLHNGSIDGDDSKDASLLPDGSSSRMSDSVADVKTNFNTSSIENISEDSNTQDSLNSTGATSPVVRRGRGRGGFRGRWAHSKHNAQIRRKNKLKELIKQCTDEDLMEIVLPRLVNSVSLWEYLLMKSENGGARPQVDVIYHEFEALRQHVKQACADYMEPLTLEELEDDNLQCKMIKVADKSLAICLNLSTVTYRVKEMPPGETYLFSTLHNRLSSTAFNPLIDHTATSSAPKNTLRKTEITELVSDFGVKRLADDDQIVEPAAKRVKLSAMSSSFNNAQANLSASAGLNSSHTVATSLPSSAENKLLVRSDVTSTSSSVTSWQSGQSSKTTSLSSPVSQTVTVSSKCTSTSSNVRSPFIHISCPTTKQQPVSHTQVSTKKPSPATQRISKSQPVPVVISQPAGLPAAKTQVLPYIISSSSGSLSQALQTSTIPVVFATPGSHQTSNGTMLLTSGSSSAGHQVTVRPPAQTAAPATHIILTNQSSPSRLQKGNPSTSLVYPSAVTTVQSPSLPNNSRSLLNNMKPTEVKVSRQLFHETTSLSMSSPLTNGSTSMKSCAASLDLSQYHVVSTMVSSNNPQTSVVGSCLVSNSNQVVGKPGGNKTLVTPPSGQQFVTSPNKTVLASQMAGVDDISVLTAMGLTGDDLGPLNTSDSLNGSLSGCSHLTDSLMMSGLAANSSSVPHSADDNTELVDMVQIVNSDTQVHDSISKNSLNDSNGITLVNGSSPSFIKVKHNNILHCSTLSLSSPNSSSPLTSSETLDFMHMSSKSSKLVSLNSQDSSNIVQPVSYHVGPTGLKPDANTSIMMADISSIPLNDHTTVQIVDSVTGHLGDISPILTADELQENSINILSEPVSCSESQETDSENVDLGEVAVSDTLAAEEDGQILLSEGMSIYQTEDGTLIIQKANGNTYQLQGAQGLSLETVQALLSGTLDQLVGGDTLVDGIQTDLNS